MVEILTGLAGLLIGIFVGYVANRRYLVPSQKLPDSTSQPDGNVTYELKSVCVLLASSSDQPYKFRAVVYSDPNISGTWTIRGALVRGIPAGVQVQLTYQYYTHGTNQAVNIPSTMHLGDMGTTAEFNGKAGAVARSQFSTDIIVWEAIASKTNPTAILPRFINVCLDLET